MLFIIRDVTISLAPYFAFRTPGTSMMTIPVDVYKRQIFISHRLQEILELSDVIQVMKDGGLVAELDPQKTTEEEIVRNMVGRSYNNYYNRNRQCFGEEILRLENVTGYHREGQIISAYTPQNISFSLNKGEVLGLSGLVGAGRTEAVSYTHLGQWMISYPQVSDLIEAQLF